MHGDLDPFCMMSRSTCYVCCIDSGIHWISSCPGPCVLRLWTGWTSARLWIWSNSSPWSSCLHFYLMNQSEIKTHQQVRNVSAQLYLLANSTALREQAVPSRAQFSIGSQVQRSICPILCASSSSFLYNMFTCIPCSPITWARVKFVQNFGNHNHNHSWPSRMSMDLALPSTPSKHLPL